MDGNLVKIVEEGPARAWRGNARERWSLLGLVGGEHLRANLVLDRQVRRWESKDSGLFGWGRFEEEGNCHEGWEEDGGKRPAGSCR